MRSARNLYRLNLLIAGLGTLAVGLATAVALRHIELGSLPADRLASYCRRLLLPQVTIASVLALALGALGVVVIARAALSAWRQLRACRCFLRALNISGERDLGLTRVRIIGGSEPEAFCAGLLRPRIYLSLGAIEQLGPAQIEAVVAHEAHHARRRDPLRLLVIGVLADALFFLPALQRLKGRYGQLAEMAADEAAVAAADDPSPLAAALVHFGQRGAPGIVGIAPERVDHLLGEAPRWELPLSLIVSATVTVAGLVALALSAAQATGGARLSLALLAAQSCMLMMTALPLLALAGFVLLGRRALCARS